jgi:hypothetical protein
MFIILATDTVSLQGLKMTPHFSIATLRMLTFTPTECHTYADMLNVVMLNVVILRVIMQNEFWWRC